MVRKIDRATPMEFVQKRRQATGGYRATPRPLATKEETFFGVAICLVLGDGLSKPRLDQQTLAEYLAQRMAAP